MELKLYGSGKGFNEKSILLKKFDKKNFPIEKKMVVIKIDKKYFRPNEVDNLVGNSAKAKKF